MTTHILTALRQLKLGGIANALQSQLEQVGTYEGLAFSERLALLVEQEVLSREQRKQERLIRQARFKLSASVADIDYQHPRNLTKAQIARLAQGDWINRGQNLLMTGPCGSTAKPTWPAPWVTTPACTATAFATIASHACYWN